MSSALPPDPVDMAQRWARARVAAAAGVLEKAGHAPGAEATEIQLAVRALETDEAEALRAVFTNSHALGRSASRHFRWAPRLSQLPALLDATGSPCLSGTWMPAVMDAEAFRPGADVAQRLARPGCAHGTSPAACDWWREATDGLVLGLTGAVRHTRHRSRGHGDATCEDVLFHGDDSTTEHPLRFGTIPDDMAAPLASVASALRLWNSAARVDWLGLSEGVLVYRVRGEALEGGVALRPMLEQQLQRRVPGIRLQELAPRPVLGADGC